jgi:hypothetical protein
MLGAGPESCRSQGRTGPKERAERHEIRTGAKAQSDQNDSVKNSGFDLSGASSRCLLGQLSSFKAHRIPRGEGAEVQLFARRALPNAPSGLNPSAPTFLFKAASIAARTCFWLVSKLRRVRRPTLPEGSVRLFMTGKGKRFLRETNRFVLCQFLHIWICSGLRKSSLCGDRSP